MNTVDKGRRKLQEAGLKILKWFVLFTSKRGLTYTALGGTLPGAVRHEEFIPWDDAVASPDEVEKLLIAAKKHTEYAFFFLRVNDIDGSVALMNVCVLKTAKPRIN